jgi:hypothetical protein
VGRGVEKLDGISEVKIVPDGERTNFCVIVLMRAWVKPAIFSK